jgi:4,5-dihydroxyphthalate decarboxylase
MLRLTLAAGHYDRTEALRDGRVRPEGIELTYLTLRVEEIFWRMAQCREFDGSEFSWVGM